MLTVNQLHDIACDRLGVPRDTTEDIVILDLDYEPLCRNHRFELDEGRLEIDHDGDRADSEYTKYGFAIFNYNPGEESKTVYLDDEKDKEIIDSIYHWTFGNGAEE